MEEDGEQVLLPKEENNEEVKKEEIDSENAEKKDNVNESLIQVENNVEKEEKKGKIFSLFDRKKTNSSEEPTEEVKESNPPSNFSFKKLFSKNEPKTNAVEEEKQNGTEQSTEQNQSQRPLKQKLPKFSSFLDRFRKGKYEVAENIELGNEPKAGLASMETLDDSTKDPWTENGDTVDTTNKEKEANESQNEQPAEKPINIWQSIQSYECSIDDVALFAGIIIFIFLVGLIIIFTLTASAKQPISPTVRDGKIIAVSSCGKIEGKQEESAYAFRGIPYAKQPIGNLRFTSAQSIQTIDDCWNGTLYAHNASQACLQYDPKSGNVSGVEDCLTLDIITPEVRYINLLPVVVMIGADDFFNGSPTILRPSARYARSESVIFVRPNFRMNAFGYLALESISNSSNIPSSGNYALSDIIAALEWINLNIHNFGGDKNSVTLFGYRTGATLVTALTASPKATKYFTKVWASSGSQHFSGKSLEESERENAVYASQFPDVKSLEDWQKVDSTELMKKIPESWTKKHANALPSRDEVATSFHDWIVLDGVILKKHPEDFWKSVNPKIKMVIGTTAHAAFDDSEGSIFNGNLTEEEIVKYVDDSKIGSLNLTEEAFNLYGKTKEGLISMISDIRIVCPLLVQARSQSNPDFSFYISSQNVGPNNLATIDSDILAILGRLKTDSPEKRRYFNAFKQLFYHFVYHGKVNHQFFEIQQDVLPKTDFKNCDFWISKDIVPSYAAYF
ncbi:neurotactin [Chironomus tepperi]|uniref:neurotactin n=1 Tax=Chironomus tepperi TaxID=113505 RepID=UPI00391F214C